MFIKKLCKIYFGDLRSDHDGTRHAHKNRVEINKYDRYNKFQFYRPRYSVRVVGSANRW